ncbi:MAG: hypothetical protein Q9183_004288, partial [Haloplaca sp. 2 TL-2023]
MSIATLPAQTIRAIGSGQVLTDSASVVKELVDNALDAHSTSITIEISANALDVIQVKDNGHGIAPADHALVCKRYCTSKIKDMEDLATIGGTSLGFRGEALASAVEMSGGLVLSTRIAGEATGVSLKVSHNGEVENQSRVPQAVGTTVRVTEFLKSLPVRRQTALKNSAKQLAKVKRTLQAYALARPSVRFSLKVLKAKSDKDNWTYAPKSEASVSDAAIKVLGKKLIDCCQWHVYCPETVDDKDDLSAICNAGQYLAMDSRPVSCTRGTLKQIVQLFKSYLNNANSAANQKLTNPFLCMNIICPSGAYDANVEPAKDDVLFTDPNRVIYLVESLFKSIYGVLESKNQNVTNGKPSVPRPRGFELLLARKPPPEAVSPERLGAQGIHPDVPNLIPPTEKNAFETIQSPTASSMRSDLTQPQITRETHADNTDKGLSVTSIPPRRQTNGDGQAWRRSMYAEDPDEELNLGKDASPLHSSEDEEDLKDVKVFNPWTLAKLNAPLRSQKQTESSSDNLGSNNQLPTPARRRSDHIGDLSSPLPQPIVTSTPGLPSPAKSSNANEPSSPEPFPYPQKAWGRIHNETNQRHHRSSTSSEDQSFPSALDTWVQRPPRDQASELNFLPDPDLLTARSRPRDFIPASELPQGTPLSNIPDIAHQRKRKAGARKQQAGN